MNSIETVFVIDDDASVRRGLARLVRCAGYNVRTFDSARAFLDGTPGDSPACIVLDVQMPEMDGLRFQEELAVMNYHPPIIFLTGHGDIPASVRAIKKGAMDFLEKPVDEHNLLTAITRALAEDRKLRAEFDELQTLRARLKLLTAREFEVLQQVITGAPNKLIADRLNISEKTVKAHRSRLVGKLAVKTVAELVRFAQKAGIELSEGKIR